MENFEYSIQLNDRDWAEFYFVSEECRLIPPALAAAEEQLLSDLEEGEAEGKEGPRAHPKASPLSVGEVPSGHLLAEDAFSGSEDESDVGSVSKFLCRGSQPAFRPSQPFLSPFPSLPFNPQLPGPTASSVPLSVAEEGGVGVAGRPMDPKTKAETHIITQMKDSQEPPPRPEMGEKSSVPLPLGSSPAAETTGSPEGANGLKLNYPEEDHVSPTASAACRFPGSTSNTAVSRKLEFPKLGDAALEPGSLGVSSVLSPTSGEAENPEKGAEGLQVASRTSFQETHSLSSQEHSVQVTPLLVNHRARTSRKEEEGILKTKSGAEHSRSFSPNTSQEGDRAKDNGVEGCPEVLEEDGSPEPSLEVVHTSSGKTERQNNGEPRLHLGPAIPREGEALTRTRENPRLVPYPLNSNDCSEETLTHMTWPEVYDYFFSDDDLHEIERPSSQEGRPWKTSHDHPSELPAMSGPEMYEYFFQDVGESRVEEETWSQVGPLETSLSSAHGLVPSSDLEEPPSNMSTTDPMGFPEVCEHFFAHQPQDKSSRRLNILAVPTSELGKAVRALTSFVCRPVRFLRSRPRRRRSQARVMLVSPTLLDGTSPRPENLGVAVFKPVLLANFGTLSAIRCFRRQVVMESHHGS
ncbi:PGC-1 and ERR-induced regulator in muscle protein 1 isoform X2 [Ahaetulla prasina]|uniref:PGC-1 and ERR-induced regulator in muscle protein 1 isoform X2 n=1 Tax=Ahaetulla prasina TaxID=499056 RepID=UPI00264A0C39|nr:PGC-1 and ERR-induced regulator in muscle protein 1 isoform X2 [Ahaetulla prasina]